MKPRIKKIVFWLLLLPLILYFALVVLYFSLMVGSPVNWPKSAKAMGFFIPTRKWRAKAVTLSGKTVSVQAYRMYGQDMSPVILHINGTTSGTPLYETYSKGESSWKDHQRWFMVYISEEEMWGKKLQTPTFFWFPWPHMFFNPKYDYQNEMHGGHDGWHLTRDSDESITFSNTQITVTVSKKKGQKLF